MQDLLIFPYSGTAIEALDCLGNEWNCVGFISDDPSVIGKFFFGIQVFDRTVLDQFLHARVLTVHGSPESYLKRADIFSSLSIPTDRLATVIHPNASISKYAQIGYNVLVMAGAVITANVCIGNHVIILPNAVVHHDSKIGNFTLVGANVTVAGNVTVEENCYLGAASSIKNGISLGPKTLLGIGANVVSSYHGNIKLIGNPAKPLNNECIRKI